MASDERLKQLAKDSLKMPDSWVGPQVGYYEDYGNTGLALYRDANLIDKSNWDVITNDLITRFPHEWMILHNSHWAFGYNDEFFVKVYDDDENVSEVFKAAVEWAENLENYAIADESNYSQLQYDETLKNIEWEGRGWIPAGKEPREIFTWLWNNQFYAEDDEDNTWYSEDEIRIAVWNLGWADPEDEEDWHEWLLKFWSNA